MSDLINCVAFVDFSKAVQTSSNTSSPFAQYLLMKSDICFSLFLDFVAEQSREDIEITTQDIDSLCLRFKATEETLKLLQGTIFNHYGLCNNYYKSYHLFELRFEKDYRGVV